ncbi:MAG: tRNA pseudouridine(55) synthase TruB [Gammaproteobacteria bacterium]|nr:tRNA pseudouridine(55) synthase TruB [Gammaproteobacteria bacterium]
MGNRGKSRNYREVDGILILDKPIGCSSNQALQQVRKLFRARKAGHCGSLDPLATGVLPICLGEATKFSSYLLAANKTYRATCRLGQTTTTGDAEGNVIDSALVRVDEAQIRKTLELFVGQIEQVPPMHSALKHQGKRLYQLAREGIQVERTARRVQIHRLELCAFSEQSLSIEVCCSKGTYIRTLAEDIGIALGCGAHVSSLHRSSVDSFVEQDAVSIPQLELLALQGLDQLDNLLLPLSSALMQFPEVMLEPSASIDIRHGKRIMLARTELSGLCRLVSRGGRFIGLGELASNGELSAKRLINTAR